jgi:hypothetical protein
VKERNLPELKPGPVKCSKKGWCSPLDTMATDLNERRGGGLCEAVMLNFKDEGRVYKMMYRRSAKDRGLFLNFCPWCGANIENGLAQP